MSYNNDNKVASVTVAIQPQSTLSPWGTNTGFEYLQEVYEDLFEQDDSGDMYPVLADKSKGEFGGYDHKAGSGDYTVYLYDYIKDSAGNPITASDVKFSFEYQLNNATTSGWKKFQSVEVVDDTTCIFHFSSELTQIGELKNIWARCPIVSEAAFNASQSQFASDMCGTGPYMLESYASGASVVLVKNPNYWQTDASLLTQRQQANADKITYDFIDEAAQQVIALETGSVDAVYNVSASNLADFQEGGSYADQFSIKEWLQTGVRYIMGAAGLAYIGLGIQPPTPEWGAMLSSAKSEILTKPYLLIFPGLCIAVTVLAINMFGDGLRDAMDPKLKD